MALRLELRLAFGLIAHRAAIASTFEHHSRPFPQNKRATGRIRRLSQFIG